MSGAARLGAASPRRARTWVSICPNSCALPGLGDPEVEAGGVALAAGDGLASGPRAIPTPIPRSARTVIASRTRRTVATAPARGRRRGMGAHCRTHVGHPPEVRIGALKIQVSLWRPVFDV